MGMNVVVSVSLDWVLSGQPRRPITCGFDQLIDAKMAARQSASPHKNSNEEEEDMSGITAVAKQFFEACEAGKGWEVCKAYCTPSASFIAQSEPLADVRTLQAYSDWMKGLLTFMPDGRYVVKSFATDDERNSVCAYGVFSATHTGQGGPCPPTGKSTTTDYVYVMEFDGDKIRHMTKIWNSGWAMKELGWA
jgi:predicted ester cyclase